MCAGEVRERESERGKGKERRSRQHVERVYYKHTGALSMRIQGKKDSLEGKEMERGAEREGVTEEIDAVFAVCCMVCRYLCFSGPEFMGALMLCSIFLSLSPRLERNSLSFTVYI